MEKYELEYTINTSDSLLYKRLSTPTGLSEWFADDVIIKSNLYTFKWEDYEQNAHLISQKKNEYIRFKWEENEDDEQVYFEFKLNKNPLTGDIALLITDFAEDETDKEDAVSLWDKQVGRLKHVLGC